MYVKDVVYSCLFLEKDKCSFSHVHVLFSVLQILFISNIKSPLYNEFISSNYFVTEFLFAGINWSSRKK